MLAYVEACSFKVMVVNFFNKKKPNKKQQQNNILICISNIDQNNKNVSSGYSSEIFLEKTTK
jgi:hypothetical protein